MLEYGKQHQTCNVPSTVLDFSCDLEGMREDGGVFHYRGNLGEWVSKQRSLYKGTKTGERLASYRESKLQELVDQGEV